MPPGRPFIRLALALSPLLPAAATAAAQAPRRVEVELVAAPARLELRQGSPTDAYAYNGTVPGPVLEFREGDEVVVRFRNELPETTTVHWHGLHLPFEADGSPFHPVAPGEAYEYRFDIRPGSAGTYWYHPASTAPSSSACPTTRSRTCPSACSS